ncbi:MAG: hypothetical protein ABI199_09760 [Bacteroidia bacterium]
MAKGTITKMGPQPSGKLTCVGSIQDESGTVVPFQQDYAVALGLAVGSRVSYETITTPATGKLANSLTPLEKGKILTVNTDNQTGTLSDNASGNEIPFDQSYLKESGISVGSIVKYETVDIPAGGGVPAQTIAVSLVFVRN